MASLREPNPRHPHTRTLRQKKRGGSLRKLYMYRGALLSHGGEEKQQQPIWFRVVTETEIAWLRKNDDDISRSNNRNNQCNSECLNLMLQGSQLGRANAIKVEYNPPM